MLIDYPLNERETIPN